MHKIITIVVMLFLASNVLAEDEAGVVNEINVKYGYIIINQVKYNIEHGKTKLFSGGNSVDLGLLKKGSTVNFSSDDSFVTKIISSPMEKS